MAKKPSIRDVAQLAQVSTATVSNVYSGKKPVNDDLRMRVLDAASSLGYQVNRAASQLRSQNNKIVTVLVPNITDTFFATIVTLIEGLAFDNGYDVIVATAQDNAEIECSRIKALLSWQPAGMIVIPCSAVVPAILKEKVSSFPIVLVDRVDKNIQGFDSVTINNKEAGQLAFTHLMDAGHRDVLIIASDPSYPPIHDRIQGAKLAASTKGFTPALLPVGSDLNAGAKTIGDWLDRNNHPSAIFSLTNVTTLSTLTALAERGINIKEDISLLAFDDYAWMSARSASLSTIRQPVEAIAQQAWDHLVSRINDDAHTAQHKATVLVASLIERNSVKDINKEKAKM